MCDVLGRKRDVVELIVVCCCHFDLFKPSGDSLLFQGSSHFSALDCSLPGQLVRTANLYGVLEDNIGTFRC